MKKLVILFLSVFLMNSAFTQITTVNESFETWPAPDWSTYMYEGGGWFHSPLWGSDLGYGGGNCALHKIWNDAVDDWLVSPQIDVISSNYELVFYEKSNDLQYYTYAGIHISTASGDPADGNFVEISESLQVEDQWVEHIVDLSSYNGESIYIAFVFQGATECWTQWLVDEVVVAPNTFIDGALIEIVNPTGINPIPGTEDIIVKMINYGTDVINEADIEWHINGVLQGTYQTTNLNLASGSEDDITVGQYNFASQGDYIISLNLLLSGDINSSNDSIEGIYYVTDPKDAALQDIKPEGYIPVAGNNDVLVSVLNNGDYIIEDITVAWQVNGIPQTDYLAASVGLEPGDVIDLIIGQYSFTDGLSEIYGTIIISGDENLSNNTGVSYVAVNALWESFEGDAFPPEMWNADDYPLKDNMFPAPHGDYYYVAETDNNYFGQISDTLFTPLLDIQYGDEITFMINNSAFFVSNDNLIWKDGTTGEVHLIEAINSQLEQWDEVTIDISAAAGINYIGFVNEIPGGYAMNKIDMITSTASIYLFNEDLGIRDFEFEYLAGVNELHTFSVSLRNYGLNQVPGSSYTVKIMTENGDQLAEQSGVTLNSWDEATIDVIHTFTEVDVLKVYAVIDFPADQMESNNISETYSVYPVPADIIANDIGFAEAVNLMIPFNTGGDTWTLGADDLSQTLFFQDELNMEGNLYGITLYYKEIHGVGQYLPLQVWLKLTDLEDLTGGWIPTSEMQMVFNDTIDVYPGFNSVYIPFDDPVLITGNENIAIQYYQYDPEWPFTACRFYSTLASGPVRSISQNDVYDLDPNDPPDFYLEQTVYPYTSFVFQPIGSDGVISGTVYDENNDPIPWANVSVGGTSIIVNTNENGEYILPELPYSTYDITASMFSFSDSTQTIQLNQANETLDFYLDPLPLVSVFGEVYGSNAPEIPLEDVLVTLNGYQFLSTNTNELGEFLYEDVYGNNEYIITFHLYGYHDYIDTLLVEDTDIDLGNIILDQEFISAYNVNAIGGSDEAMIEWLDPITSQKVKLRNDLNIISHSYMNEPYEEVWLGNIFENENAITLTSVEVLWDIYENAHDFVTIDIFDNMGSLLVSSLPFQTFNDSLMTIDIPNIYVEDDFYAMVHWKDNPASTDPLTIDFSDDVPNTAYIKYPDQAPVLFSDFLGSPNASFFVRVNILEENPDSNGTGVISYNIYRGLAENIDEAAQWPVLNTEPITDLFFIDETWSNSNVQLYTYAVEAVYTEGDAELSFSNFISGATSIIEKELDEVQMYPNPASSSVNFNNVEGKTLYIYNISGALIYSEKAVSPLTQVDLSSFNNGTYIVSIVGPQKREVKKLLVAK